MTTINTPSPLTPLEEDNKLFYNNKNKSEQRNLRIEIAKQNLSKTTRNFEEFENILPKRPSFLESNLHNLIENTITLLFYLILMVLIILDEMYIIESYKTSGMWETIKVLIYIECIFTALFFMDVSLKLMLLGFQKLNQNKTAFFNIFIRILALGFIISEIILLSYMDNQTTTVIRGLSRVSLITLLFPRAIEFIKAKRSKVNIIDTDLNTPIQKILEIMEAAKHYIDNENILIQYNWAMELIASNKLYEPILDILEKKHSEDESEIKHSVIKYVLGVRGESITGSTTKRRSLLVEKDDSPSPLTKREKISIPENIIEVFDRELIELNFNIFEMKKITDDHELPYIIYYIFKKLDIFAKLNISARTFSAFIKKINDGYHDNPYHNKTHAADVTQAIHYFLKKCSFTEIAELSLLEQALMYISAAVHDYDHPGTNNTYQINTRSIYAIRYNDKSVLEMHHISCAWQILMHDEYNIFKNFNREEINKIRERLISMILATDMASHFSDIARMKGRIAAGDFNPKDKDKNICMEMIVHACDISNPAKPFEIYKEWTNRIITELWHQGDLERKAGLPITYLCDRYSVNIGKSQIGFIDFIVFPTFDLLKQSIPKLDLSHFEINKSKWKELIEFYDKELNALNEEKKKKENEKVSAS